uniref:Uncharacterized protein n=1 Tax=Candidatus Kentrum sp. FW TaxID=2126338 RepID=A0A450T503_9GAMM|nr:MAG: hypothetical protein BECKFW1821C_GA0114237_100183 [Candidatus Kentron sp. FW]
MRCAPNPTFYEAGLLFHSNLTALSCILTQERLLEEIINNRIIRLGIIETQRAIELLTRASYSDDLSRSEGVAIQNAIDKLKASA